MSWRESRTKPNTWRSIRNEVLERDNHECQIKTPRVCSYIANEVDHIIPTAEGGTDNLTNLRAACQPCHAIKSQKERLRGINRRTAKRTRPKETPPAYVIPPEQRH